MATTSGIGRNADTTLEGMRFPKQLGAHAQNPRAGETRARFNPLYAGWFFAVHVGAAAALPFFSWQNLMICLIGYFVTACLGITFGFHRYYSHRSFKMHRYSGWFFAICGSLAFQGGVRDWVARHRMHHAFTDSDKDPHNARRGFWHSHLGWLIYHNQEFHDSDKIKKFARDIDRDPFLVFISKTWVLTVLQLVLFLLLWASMGVGAALWGVFVRLVLVYHVTWFVNSATHKFGYRTFETAEDSKNCWWVALLTFGEGWHNNHHFDQKSARAGLRFWEFDPTYLLIRAFSFLGLVWDIQLPSAKHKQIG